ncbi:MAG: hypothetical protein K0M63_09145 [Weeksellaceae bacterium]|nr:hypothetical protein [Weeksellaceae bacterium]
MKKVITTMACLTILRSNKDNGMKSFLVIVMISFHFVLYPAQNERFNGFILQPEMGMLTYEQENTFKTTAYSMSGGVGKEFHIPKNLSLVTGIHVHNIYADYHNGMNMVFLRSNFVSVPVNLRLYSTKNSNSAFYSGLGLDNKFKFNESAEEIPTNQKYKRNNAYHLGSIIEFGFRTKIHDQVDLLTGINYRSDILQVGYKENKSKITNAVNLSIGFEFFKKTSN